MTYKNYVSYYSRTLVIDYRLIKNRLFYFARKNAKKVSALSMAGKLLSFTVLFAVLPLNIKPATPKAYDTNITMDKNSPAIVLVQDKKTAIELCESEFQKEENKKIAKAVAAPKVVAEVRTYNDPSDFRELYKQAGAQFGIPWQLIEAVHQVESGKSGSTTTSSYAGAQGPMQFMPGTWRSYGIDANGDGVADINNVVDAIFGGAHLLARSGADEGRIDDALFNYNHAQWYVDKVKTIAYEIGM